MQVLCGLQGLFLLFNCQTSAFFLLRSSVSFHPAGFRIFKFPYIDIPIHFVPAFDLFAIVCYNPIFDSQTPQIALK